MFFVLDLNHERIFFPRPRGSLPSLSRRKRALTEIISSTESAGSESDDELTGGFNGEMPEFALVYLLKYEIGPVHEYEIDVLGGHVSLADASEQTVTAEEIPVSTNANTAAMDISLDISEHLKVRASQPWRLARTCPIKM